MTRKKKPNWTEFLDDLPKVPVINKYNWISELEKTEPELWEALQDLISRYYDKDPEVLCKINSVAALSRIVSAKLAEVGIIRSPHSVANSIRDSRHAITSK